MQSLLLTLVVIVTILIAVLLLIPDRLERRALRNQQRREQLMADLAALSARTALLHEDLAPYETLVSAAYVNRVHTIDVRVAQLQAEQAAMAGQIEGLRLPDIPRLTLPVQHFLRVPSDVSAVFSDSTQLNKLAATVERAHGSVQDVQVSLRDLSHVPAELRADSQSMLRRLDAVLAAIQVEKRAGIATLEAVEQHIVDERRLVAELEDQFHDRAPLATLDASARKLEISAVRTAATEAHIAQLNRARLQLDRRIQETTAELDDVQVVVKGGNSATPVSRATSALLIQSAALLNEAVPEARSRHEFATAHELVTAAHQLIGLGRNMSESERLLAYLEAHDAGLGFGPDIAATRRELAGIMLRLSPVIGSAEALRALALSDDLAELSARSADLHHELSGLAQSQREAVAQLERDAVTDRDRVVAAWEDSQRLLPLSAEDPLVGRYQRVLGQFTAARGDPAALQTARKDAAVFLATQREWSERLATQQRWQTGFRTELPRLVDQALAEAQGWACLQPGVAAIQQRVADFSQLQARFNKARTSAEALAIMDQFDRLESDIRHDYDQLADQAARLRWLQDDLTKTLALVADNGDEAASPRRAQAQQMIDHRVSQAHVAARYEDATQAMLWAAELAQNLST